MRIVICTVTGLLVMLALAPRADAQAALRQLEQQLGNGSTATNSTGYLGLVADDRQEAGRGVRVVEIVTDGPAQQAGLQTNDLVVGIDSSLVRNMEDFARVLEKSPPGTQLKFKIERAGQAQDLGVTLGTKPSPFVSGFPEMAPQSADPTTTQVAPVGPPMLGVQLASVTPEVVRALRLPSGGGALVVNVIQGSPAEQAGIKSEAVIVGFGGRPVDSPDTLTRMVAEINPGQQVRVAYYYRGALNETPVTLGGTVTTVGPLPPLVLEAPVVDDRTQKLEQRIVELEQRVSELEKKLAEK